MSTTSLHTASSKLWTLVRNDLRQIFRDKILTAILVFPFATVLLVRFALPMLMESWPILEPYYLPALGLLCVVNASFPAYVVSFIMLDEKDADLFTALRVTPLSTLMFVGYRLSFITFLGGMFTLFTLLAATGIDHEWDKMLIASLLCGLGTPLTTLAVVTFAQNKIEGLTLLKGFNFLFILPFLAFFTESSWRFVLGIIPFYWTYQIFGEWNTSDHFYLLAMAGVLAHILVLVILYHLFRKRIF